jgi:ABC-type multidrug transport system fused ATPase/permease subunit
MASITDDQDKIEE